MKMKKILFFSFFLIQALILFPAFSKINYDEFGKIPILNEGRVKPLDTFARVHLLLFYEKSSLGDISAIEWLAELIFSKEKAFSRNIFRLRNTEVLKALNIQVKLKGVYSFYELSLSLKKILPQIGKMIQVEPELRTPSQIQLINLYKKVMIYYEIGKSLSLLDPRFEVTTLEVGKILDMPLGKKLSYVDLFKRKDIIVSISKDAKKRKKLSVSTKYFIFLEKRLSRIEEDSNTKIFKIVPPQFSNKKEEDWYSPWETLLKGGGGPSTLEYFGYWSSLSRSYREKDGNSWSSLSKKIRFLAKKMAPKRIDSKNLALEKNYNQWDIFVKSASFYILSFVLLSVSWLYRKSFFQKIAFLSLLIGGGLHLIGLTLRCYIMNRPPVSTLYESIVFVALISVLASAVYEKRKKDSIGIFMGSCLGAILLFISFSYQKDGDSMGMLAAVLNTNFWLATHVVTITIGYGCSFVTSLLGHVYLIQIYYRKRNPDSKFDLKSLEKSMNGVTLYSLFFVVLGTILGGIWADQSWGRFWGWDPKENGAMLICLWLLLMIHGRLAGFFHPRYFSAGLVLTSVVVSVAWFGVNLLNIGLHSYGFTDSIAYNLFYFGLMEVVFVILFLHLTKERLRK